MNRRTFLGRVTAASVVAVAGCAEGEPAPEETVTPDGTTTTDETPSGATDTPEAAVTVVVGAGGSLRFEPESFEIAAGEAVRWTWEAGGHNVEPTSTPDGADWEGTSGPPNETFEAGHVHTHAFSTAGEYEYHCAPHQSAGMTGSFTVE